MRWLTNTYDPSLPDVRMHVVRCFPETFEESWRLHLDYLKDKIIGEPQATEKYTVEQLKAMGMVGVYTTREKEE